MAAINGFILNVYELDLTPVSERLVQLPTRIGRSSLNDVCIAHRLVSEFHARLERVDGRLCVRDLNSKNGVLLEAVGSEGAARIPAQVAVDLEPYGYEFLLSPLLRVRLRPASGRELSSSRHSQALGSVLGNPGGARPATLTEPRMTDGRTSTGAHATAGAGSRRPLAPGVGSGTARVVSARPPAAGARQPSPAPSAKPPPALAPPESPSTRRGPGALSPAVEPYASMFVEPPSGSLELPPLPGGSPPLDRAATPAEAPALQTRVSHSAPERLSTLFEPPPEPPHQPVLPPLTHTAWEGGNGTLPAAVAPSLRPSALPGRSLEALALRGLRELAASLLPGQPVESAADIVQLVTKLHDAIEMFCRCFIPVREACSRFITTDELERAAMDRCHDRSASYIAIEGALEPRAVAAALLDWRNDDQDAPRAVEHILADLMLHQLAMSQSALEGTKALLDELSPARFEAGQLQLPQRPSVLARLGLAGGPERALWEAFAARHAELDGVSSAFRSLFGEHFSRAYAAHWPGHAHGQGQGNGNGAPP